MPKKSWYLFGVLAMLLAAALACNTITGGLGRDDAQATADAIEEQAADAEAEARETIEAAEATAGAALDSLNDNENANDSGDDSGNNNDNQNGNGSGNAAEDPFDGQGPDDVPVYTDAGDLELVLADDSTLSYFIADAEFDEVVDFYREAMPDQGWELADNGDTVFGPLATLVYEKDGRSATVTITSEPIGDRIVVTVFVIEE